MGIAASLARCRCSNLAFNPHDLFQGCSKLCCRNLFWLFQPVLLSWLACLSRSIFVALACLGVAVASVVMVYFAIGTAYCHGLFRCHSLFGCRDLFFCCVLFGYCDILELKFCTHGLHNSRDHFGCRDLFLLLRQFWILQIYSHLEFLFPLIDLEGLI